MDQSKDALFLRQLLNSAPDTILVVSESGIIEECNGEAVEMFGYTQDELVGQSVDMLVPVSIRDRHGEMVRSYFANPRRRPMGAGLDLKGSNREGKEIPVEISLNHFEFAGETRAIAIIRDVRESFEIKQWLRQSKEALEKSNQELEQFAYIASHDLQEPLRMITGYTQLLSRKYGRSLDETAHEYIETIIAGAKRMQTLITDLLTYSRLNTMSSELIEVDLNDVLGQVLANLEVQIDDAKAVVKHSELPVLKVDRVQFVQLFQNLVSNGVKFCNESAPMVEIGVKEQDSEWEFHVTDNGIGIDEEYHDKIFEVFQRLHRQDEFEGTGIGLANCKKIVEKHGGKIWVESKPGSGASFRFTLPKEV